MGGKKRRGNGIGNVLAVRNTLLYTSVQELQDSTEKPLLPGDMGTDACAADIAAQHRRRDDCGFIRGSCIEPGRSRPIQVRRATR